MLLPFLVKLKKCRLLYGIMAVFFMMMCLNVPAGASSGLTGNTTDTDLYVQQDRTVTGVVTDESGEPLPGVAVTVRGTTIGTVTNVEGVYSIDVPATAEYLRFSYVGMLSQDIMVGDQRTINVILRADVIGLEEIVVVGYGTQVRANVVGSVTTVRTDEITAAPVSRVSNALAGRLPGLVIVQGGGEPGYDHPSIMLVRGNSTLNNNTPLVIVDGIQGRDINSLHPDDIESITVLRDASAAIYGARAANGVILVTTKRG